MPREQVRPFPRPWTVRSNEAAYWVEAANGARFAFCYFREAELVGTGTSYLTREEARRIATNVARLPELLKGGRGEPAR